MAVTEELDVRTNTAQSAAAMKQLGGALQSNFVKANLMATAMTKATSVLTENVRAGIQSALDYERTLAQQSVALRVWGQDSQQARDALEAQSTLLERITGVAQEDIRSLQNRALALKVSVSETDALVRASSSLANVLGVNVRDAMTQLVKSQSGLVEETLKQIPAVASLTREQLENGAAIEVINEHYSEFVNLATSSGGSAASISELATAWGNLGKAFARAGLESERVQSELSFMSDWALVMQKQIEQGDLGQAFTTLFFNFAQDIQGAAAALRREEKATADAASAAIEAESTAAFQRGEGAVKGLSFNLKQLQEDAKQFKKEAEAAIDIVGLAFTDAQLRRLAAAEFVGPLPTIAQTDPLTAQIFEAEKRQEADTLLTEVLLANAQRRMDIKEKETAALIASQETQTAAINEGMEIATRGLSLIASSGIEVLEALVTGADVSGAAFVRSMMRMLGQQTLASGVAHLAQAGAMFFNPLTAAAAGPAAAAAGVEIAVGSALVAGNLALASAGVGLDATPSAGAASSGGAGGAGSVGSSAGFPSLQGASNGLLSTEGLTIVINGPTFATETEIGVAIERARRAAISRGAI